jgi:hypothetical protein
VGVTGGTSLLRWLSGADPDELPEAELVGLVARKAALRTPRFADYDVRWWAAHASSVKQSPQLGISSAPPLPDLVHVLLASLALHRSSAKRCWLNRVAIELPSLEDPVQLPHAFAASGLFLRLTTVAIAFLPS